MQDWPASALNLTGGWTLAGAVLGALAAWAWFSRKERRAPKPADPITAQLRQAQDELTRLLGRYQLLESSHQTLQSDLSQERSVLMSLHAELARERSLRVNLELALDTVRRERTQNATPPPPASEPARRPADPASDRLRSEVVANPTPTTSAGLEELLKPINAELEAVRRELAERRERSDQTIGRMMGQIRELEAGRPSVIAAKAPPPPPLEPAQPVAPATQVRPASKAERELNNFFRRIQVDPSGAKSGPPGADSPPEDELSARGE